MVNYEFMNETNEKDLKNAKKRVFLEPTMTLDDWSKVEGYDFDKRFDFKDFIESLYHTGFQATQLHDAMQIFKEMRKDKATVFLGFTSNMVSCGVRENIKYMPLKARYKIYIIDEVHMLSNSAFNALLKTLEEPPPHVVFIFATTEPHKLPDTILSRCQRYDFRRITIKQTVDYLKKITENENIEISDYGLNLIAKESYGGLRDALSLLDQLASFTDKKIEDEKIREILGVVESDVLFEIIDSLLGGNPLKCVEIVEKIYSSGFDIKKFSQEILEQLRNLVIFKFSDKPSEIIELPEGYIKNLENIASKVDSERLWLIFDQVTWEIDSILKSTNPRFNLELVLMKLAKLENLVPIEKLLERLESIEKNIAFISAASEESSISHRKKKNIIEMNLEDSPLKTIDKKDVEKEDEWWNKLSEILLDNFKIKNTKPFLPSVLAKVKSKKVEGELLTLAIEDGGLNDWAVDFFKEDSVKKVVDDFFGRQIKFNIIICTNEEKLNNGKNSKLLKEKALKHPLVKEALSSGCQIIGIKTFEGEKDE